MCVHACMNACMYVHVWMVYMHSCIYVCMYICMYVLAWRPNYHMNLDKILQAWFLANWQVLHPKEFWMGHHVGGTNPNIPYKIKSLLKCTQWLMHRSTNQELCADVNHLKWSVSWELGWGRAPMIRGAQSLLAHLFSFLWWCLVYLYNFFV